MATRFTWDLAKATRKLVLVVVVFVDRSEPSVEVIHIISARKAVAYEEGIYQDHGN